MELKWITMMPTESDFDFWIKNRYNVLLIGGHGSGKTSMITHAFLRNSLYNRYFSASTMDPWVDFIGVPKEVKDEHGEYLELIKPKEFRDNKVQALFFDEFNRAHPKVQNAVMELIQFKSINGKKFDNLDIVWAAMNDDSDEEEYNVHKIDRAQLDRFHIIIKIPSEPQLSYFKEKFGKEGKVAVEWWKNLSDELKKFISPRRLEYVLNIYRQGGNIEYSLPSNSNAKTLIRNLKQGLPVEQMIELIKAKDESALKAWLSKEINLGSVTNDIIQSYLSECLHLLSLEKQSELISKHDKVKKFVGSYGEKFETIIKSLRTSKDKSMRIWAESVTISEDALPQRECDFDWKPKQKRMNLESAAKAYDSCHWDLDEVRSARPKYFGFTENTELNAVFRMIKPTTEHYSTTIKLKNLSLVFKAISKTKSLSPEQIGTAVRAINHWGIGLGKSQIDKLFYENKSARDIITHLMSEYIVQKHKYDNVSVFFIEFQFMFTLYEKLKLGWVL